MEHDATEAPPSTALRPRAATIVFFAILGESVILLLTLLFIMFFIPLSSAFTLHHATTSASSSLNGQNRFTANLTLELLVEDSVAPIGNTVYYDDSFAASLFHRQENVASFSLPSSSLLELSSNTLSATIEAEFRNVSLTIDEWSNVGHACGFVYLDLRFSARAKHTQPLWPVVKDNLHGHCGVVKVQLCSSSSSSSAITTAFHASYDVHSDLDKRVRIIVFSVLIFSFVAYVIVLVLLVLEHSLHSSTTVHPS